MLDMTLNKEDKPKFIVDIDKCYGTEEKFDKITATFADKHKEELFYSTEHNLNVYRQKLENQVKDYSGPFLDKIAIKSFRTYVVEYTTIITSILGLFFFCVNTDNFFFKIMLALLAFLLDYLTVMISEVYLSLYYHQLREIEASQYFVDHKNNFMFNSNGETKYVVPIEDVANFELSKKDLENIRKEIIYFKENYGNDIESIKLSYKRKNVESPEIV